MAGVLRPSISAARAIGEGWRRVRTRAPLAVVTIWAIVTVVAIAAVAPAWAWWSGALGDTIEGARLLGSPNIGTLVELFRGAPFGAAAVGAAALAAGAIALLLNPFLAGGLLGALARDSGPRAHDGVSPSRRASRFAADGVRFYGPLLRVALIVWPIAGVATAVVAAAAAIPFAGTERPALSLAAGGFAAAVWMLGAAMLADLARIRIVQTGRSGAAAAVVAALGMGFRQGPRLALVAAVFATAFAIAGAGLVAVRAWLAGDTWPSLLLGVAAQQAHAFARTWLRATMVASELVLAEADAEARALAEAAAAAGASVAAGEERPEVLVVVEGEAGERGLRGDEGRGGDELTPVA
jgi:hypothetical protein